MKEKRFGVCIFFIILLIGSGTIFSVNKTYAATEYTWNKYNVTTTREYTEGQWGSWSAPKQDWNTYISAATYTFSASEGFSFFGTKNPAISGVNPGSVYTGSETSVTETKFENGWYTSRRTKTATSKNVSSRGSDLGQVTSGSSTAYPNDGIQNGYWYVLTSIKPSIKYDDIKTNSNPFNIEIKATSSSPCYRIAIGIQAPNSSTADWSESVYPSGCTFTKTYTPTTLGNYSITVSARSVPEEFAYSGATSSNGSYSVSTETPIVTINPIPNISLGQSVTISGSSKLPIYRMAAGYKMVGSTDSYSFFENKYPADGMYSQSFTPTTAGTYQVTLDARSYPMDDIRTGANSAVTTFVVNNKPMKPTGLKTNLVTSQFIELEWNPVTNATSYEISYTGGTGAISTTDSKKGINNLQRGTTYTFSVVSVNASGKSAPATITKATDNGDVLPASIPLTIDGKNYNAVPYIAP